MAGTPSSASYLFDQAYARILSAPVDDPDPVDATYQEPVYNFKAYVSEPSYVEAEPWGDLSAQVQYRDEAADKIAALRSVVPLEVPKTASRSALDRSERIDRVERDAVPTTKLMQKLFKPAGESAGSTPRSGSKQEAGPSAEEKLSKVISEKIEELNKEVAKQSLFQEKLSLLKRQIPEKSKALDKERAELQAMEASAREEVRQCREAELSKAEKELRIRERNQKALAALPSRKEREEKEALLATLAKLQDEAKARKSRHQLAKERLKKQLEDCKMHYEELLREKARMEAIMPVDTDYQSQSSVLTYQSPAYVTNPQIAVTSQKRVMALPRDPSPETREPIDRTFEDDQPQQVRRSEQSSTSYHEILRDGKVVRVYSDAHEETVMQSGTRKEVYANGYTLVHFANNDEKRDFPDGKSVYFYSAPGTTQVVHPDGLQVYYFSDGQKETHFPDGSKKIRFPNGTKKTISASGEETTVYLDGMVVQTDTTGGKSVLHPGGHKDITYPDGRRLRQLFNGTMQRLSCLSSLQQPNRSG